MRITPNCGRVRESWKTWGRWTVTQSLLKAMKLLNRDLGALKSKNFLPNKSTTMKSAAHPVLTSRSVLEETSKELLTIVVAEEWSEWLCCIETWLLDTKLHWCAITIPVENTAKKMAKRKANRLLLLASMYIEKLYQLREFRWISGKDSLINCDWKYRIMLSQCP